MYIYVLVLFYKIACWLALININKSLTIYIGIWKRLGQFEIEITQPFSLNFEAFSSEEIPFC